MSKTKKMSAILTFHNKLLAASKLTKQLGYFRHYDRTYCQQRAIKKAASYSSTILLPHTNFPARHKPAKRAEIDDEISQKANFDGLYEWQRKNLLGPDFVLHDGPPYANGDPHIGHAINKILKDITSRRCVIAGRRVHYVPGWDCHGLPIELKALGHGGAQGGTPLQPPQLRETAQKFAVHAANRQKQIFRSWGVMADWETGCYYTFNKSYVQNQMRKFHEMYEKGLIYRDVKPVYWSPSSGSALAEAELQYDPQHKSTELYLEIPLHAVPEQLQALCPSGWSLSAIIWTTTPWSLVGNQAVCYSPDLQYSAVRLMESADKLTDPADKKNLLIVASGLVERLSQILGVPLKEEFHFQGSILASASYRHPLKPDVVLPFLWGDHVSAEKGTGLVHTAPAHGPEDFLVALKNNIKVECHVDEQGCFSDCGPTLNGLQALKEGQEAVLQILGSHVLYRGAFIHPYPLDWRTGQPVIIRASSQWFIDTEALRNKALEALEGVEMLPALSSDKNRQGFSNQLRSRPYWCISRQRCWGTPIPVIYHRDKPIISSELIERVCGMVEKHGATSWWTRPVEDFIPDGLLKGEQVSVQDLVKGKDIMDIWLDSGLSWSSVLPEHPADLYLEGLDQFTGWFQSSLMTSIALTGKAPYRKIFVHGFAVDSKGKKMSKSLGNVVDPKTVTHGGKNLQKNPPYGVDTLRWWVACHGTQHSQIVISDNLLLESYNQIAKLRLLLKFILGAVNDLPATDGQQETQLNYIDSYMLHLLHEFENNLQVSYDSMEYNKVCTAILNFTANQISGFYVHTTKDRLYCSQRNSQQRKNCQIVLNNIYHILCQSLAPIVPHLVEESWAHHPHYDANKKPFYQSERIKSKPIWQRPFVDNLMDTIFEIKGELNKLVSGKNSLEFRAVVIANPELFDKLITMIGGKDGKCVHGELCEVFQVSEVVLVEGKAFEEEWSVTVEGIRDRFLCGRCRKYTAESDGQACERCEKVIELLN